MAKALSKSKVFKDIIEFFSMIIFFVCLLTVVAAPFFFKLVRLNLDTLNSWWVLTALAILVIVAGYSTMSLVVIRNKFYEKSYSKELKEYRLAQVGSIFAILAIFVFRGAIEFSRSRLWFVPIAAFIIAAVIFVDAVMRTPPYYDGRPPDNY